MRPNPIQKLSPDEYLEFERGSEEKHEYLNGEIFAMSGARRKHNLIAWNIGGELRSSLKTRDCEAYVSDMRVLIPATGLYTYPDLAVVCSEPRFEDSVEDVLLNPVLLIEILSKSTESYDRGTKFQHYRSIDSLKEYVLVSQTEARIEKYLKQGDGFWVLSEAAGLDSAITFESIECEISLAEVYDKVEWEIAGQNL